MIPRRLHEFSVYLDQRPGEMAGVLSAARSQGVDIHAVWVGEHKGRGLLRIVGDPVETLRAVCEHLMDSGVGPIIESEVLAIETHGQPGALRQIAIAMADERVNVRYAYIVPARGDRPECCAVFADDLDEVIQKIDAMDLPTTGNGQSNGTGA